ncbi:GGDEF domain-containing protein [Brevibacillus ruminantium]|uniref:GGDEF domain-containing protein n=1 Tax=Brevibacillus ruminantium TaxID=2950604 RepID=A0ABY4WL02_9BACL|nr:GGDEF domain-containing protein [Brevibacillus ruminantium]USG67713.1 GGDEF domain-containing protein [Brevibacillus ruminantium]
MNSRWIGLAASFFVSGVWMSAYGLPESEGTAAFVLTVAIVQTVAAYRVGQYVDRLRKLAYLDSLTGVLVNRRFFQRMEEEVERGRRHQYPVTLLFIDLDNFKVFNDTYGHLEGDKLLCDFAQLLQHSVRVQDQVGRWGGEEFVVLLPHTETEQGAMVGGRIQANVREAFKGITVSMGVATFPLHADSATQLALKADTLMYEAKKQKDCMLVASK